MSEEKDERRDERVTDKRGGERVTGVSGERVADRRGEGAPVGDDERVGEWNRVWSLALVFGIASVPWTYAFVTGGIPLWPAFIASASFYAAGGGLDGLKRGYASNLAGIGYAAATLAIVAWLGGGTVALSVVVGAFMLVASLHEFVPPLSFTPGAFFGYATLFSVHAAEATAFGVPGLAGETLAAVVSMLLGACIGLVTETVSDRLAT